MHPFDRASRAAALGQLIRQTRPALFADPEIQFPLAAALRRRTAAKAEPLYRGLLRSQLPAAWQGCARGELWLADRRGLSPKPTLDCVATNHRPRLDGALNEEMWQDAARAALKSALEDDAEWPATVMLAYDRQFLYLAVRCRKAMAADYPTSDKPRSRDPQLDARDRVQLLIDVDRDYVTYFRVTVDHRGWASESCVGDQSWDPEWYVAARSDHEWIVEAAIALEELTPRPPREGDVWALGIQRVVPAVGFQSWSQPAAVDGIPEGFGYLLFR
jgi:hypothetical protein